MYAQEETVASEDLLWVKSLETLEGRVRSTGLCYEEGQVLLVYSLWFNALQQGRLFPGVPLYLVYHCGCRIGCWKCGPSEFCNPDGHPNQDSAEDAYAFLTGDVETRMRCPGNAQSHLQRLFAESSLVHLVLLQCVHPIILLTELCPFTLKTLSYCFN